MVELKIKNKGIVYTPLVVEGITWETQIKGVAGSLSFSILKDEVINVVEGNNVQLIVDGVNVFNGFIFSKQRGKDGIIDIKAYDQLRYLKNKDTLKIEDETASTFIKRICGNFKLKYNDIVDTTFVIKSQVEENTTLFDMILNALDITHENNNQKYVLYDDFGYINLKKQSDMYVDAMINSEMAEGFSYSSSIDGETYNRVRLYNGDEPDPDKKVTEAVSDKNVGLWGVLQYFDTVKDGENPKSKAETLLSQYNKKSRTLSLDNCFGDLRIRAGNSIGVNLDLGDMKLSEYMLVVKCKHVFNDGEHFMDLYVTGGEFIE